MEWEAAQWVARRMGDQPFDSHDFDAWLAGDPRRKALFDTMWERVMGPKMDDAVNAIARQRRSSRSWLAGSAAAMLALVGGYKALPSVELFLAEPQEYMAPAGTIRHVELADGTRLTLAGRADVRVRYTRHGREVELTRGTIFANVTADERRPFRIEAGDGQIMVLGTRFEVDMKPATVRVTVEDGHVRFGTNRWFTTPIELTDDQAASLAAGELRRDNDVAAANGVALWRSEWIEYDDAPLRQVLGDLEHVSPLPIAIADETLANLKVSGRIRLIDPERQIDNLSVIHNFTVDRRKDMIMILPGKAAS